MRYKNEFIKIGSVQVKQINKTEAKKVYDEGHEIYLNACNMKLNNECTSPILVYNNSSESFEKIVSRYEYYNCCGYRGNYANYFINIDLS